MSGFVGMVNLDGRPVDRALLDRMTKSLAFRGPDGQGMWSQGNAGMGHALLRVARESAQEAQPATLDGRVFCVAHARIDAREELAEELRRAGLAPDLSRPDVELILQAWQAWQEEMLPHLLGDFCFALWDMRQNALFCARDHFGVRPFYYAQAGPSLLFSNTLDCLRLHPGITDRLNDQAIGDFLLFDVNMEGSTTFFADIRRLPPGHVLRCREGRVSVARYWKLPEAEPIEFRRGEECLERFCEVFDAAVSDRLRGESAGILLSGGLDSPSVAVSARRVVDNRGGTFALRAHTYVLDRLVRHQERHYAGMVAEALRIPIEYCAGDDARLYDHFDSPEYRVPEPLHLVMGYRRADPYADLARQSRTALTGYGGDPTLASLLTAHFKRLAQEKKYGRILRDLARYLGAEGRFSRLYLRSRWNRWFGDKLKESFPAWLRPEFADRLELHGRWEALQNGADSNHSARPESYEALASELWPPMLESFDPSVTQFRVEAAHPFFDLRVVSLLLGLPAVPWCSDKEILRQAARGYLPEAVRLRPKSPLEEDPVTVLLKQPESAWVDRFQADPVLEEYVVREQIPALCRAEDSSQTWVNLRPLSLNFWLQRRGFPLEWPHSHGGVR